MWDVHRCIHGVRNEHCDEFGCEFYLLVVMKNMAGPRDHRGSRTGEPTDSDSPRRSACGKEGVIGDGYGFGIKTANCGGFVSSGVALNAERPSTVAMQAMLR